MAQIVFFLVTVVLVS